MFVLQSAANGGYWLTGHFYSRRMACNLRIARYRKIGKRLAVRLAGEIPFPFFSVEVAAHLAGERHQVVPMPAPDACCAVAVARDDPAVVRADSHTGDALLSNQDEWIGARILGQQVPDPCRIVPTPRND